jgi:hypothetical protein
MLVAVFIVICAASFLWSSKPGYRLSAFGLTLLAMFVVFAARRRAAVVGAESALIVLGIMLAVTYSGRFARWFPFALLILVVYAGVFWNNPNAPGQPIRAFKTVFLNQTLNERDRQSDDYRLIENYNIWANIRAKPLLGSGFGVPYAKPVPLADLSSIWPFWDYIPHNAILWLWMKGGLPLFLGFWFLVGCVFTHATSLSVRLKEPLPVAILASICAVIVMVVLMAYVDLGLHSTRLMTLLGMSIGLISVVERLWPSGSLQGTPAYLAVSR